MGNSPATETFRALHTKMNLVLKFEKKERNKRKQKYRIVARRYLGAKRWEIFFLKAYMLVFS